MKKDVDGKETVAHMFEVSPAHPLCKVYDSG
jgi:hypothetical protein